MLDGLNEVMGFRILGQEGIGPGSERLEHVLIQVERCENQDSW